MLTSNQKKTIQARIQPAITGRTPTEVRDTVLYELYRHYHAITSDDILELTVLIPPPQHDSREQQIECVLDDALTYLDQWQRPRAEL